MIKAKHSCSGARNDMEGWLHIGVSCHLSCPFNDNDDNIIIIIIKVITIIINNEHHPILCTWQFYP